MDKIEKPVSDLAYIDVNNSNPFQLFHEWKQDAESGGILASAVMNLATCSRNCEVSNRNVIALKFDTDGFIFLTSRRGRKMKEINENPNVASTFLWIYKKEDTCISRQIRVEGKLEEIDRTTAEKLYNQAPFYAKIRAHICEQGEPVEWETLKNRHDEFLEKLTKTNEILGMPSEMIGFKLLPHTMDFYYSYDNFIADRVKFTKIEEENWKFGHVQA